VAPRLSVEAVAFVRDAVARLEAERDAGLVEGVELVSAFVLDEGFAERALGKVWDALSEAQRVVAVRDLRALVAAQTARDVQAWLGGAPRVTGAEDDGRTARVSMVARDGTDVAFVIRRSPDGLRVLDVEVQGVSLADGYRSTIERVFAQHGRDPSYVIARIEGKLERVHGGEGSAPPSP
jgi:ABC-type transporter MlaC component